MLLSTVLQQPDAKSVHIEFNLCILEMNVITPVLIDC